MNLNELKSDLAVLFDKYEQEADAEVKGLVDGIRAKVAALVDTAETKISAEAEAIKAEVESHVAHLESTAEHFVSSGWMVEFKSKLAAIKNAFVSEVKKIEADL
jgi:hypothetical protein